MSDSEWSDMIVGERMQVDQEFNEKVAASNFSSQQWGLIMTAVEFRVESGDDPDRARLVADTSKLDAVLPELDRMERSGMGGPAGGGGGGGGGLTGGLTGGGGSGGRGGSGGGSGFVGSIREALGLGGGEAERERRAAAEEMAQMYADDLQAKLEERGKWENVRQVAGEAGTDEEE